MKKIIFLLLVLPALFYTTTSSAQKTRKNKTARSTPAAAAPLGTTYLRAVNIGAGDNAQDISWIYLGKDGTIIKNPKYGVDPVDLVSEKKHNASKTGRYRIEGDKMMINWENGKTAEWKIEQQKNEFVSIDGGIVGKQSPLPANYRIAGQYSAESISPSVSSSNTIVFSRDGSFSQTSFGGVTTGSGSAVSQDLSDGTYTISGNTLRLNYGNGNKVISMITIWNLPDGKRYLVMNNSAFPQQ